MVPFMDLQIVELFPQHAEHTGLGSQHQQGATRKNTSRRRGVFPLGARPRLRGTLAFHPGRVTGE